MASCLVSISRRRASGVRLGELREGWGRGSQLADLTNLWDIVRGREVEIELRLYNKHWEKLKKQIRCVLYYDNVNRQMQNRNFT